jgi:hypothetical protein
MTIKPLRKLDNAIEQIEERLRQAKLVREIAEQIEQQNPYRVDVWVPSEKDAGKLVRVERHLETAEALVLMIRYLHHHGTLNSQHAPILVPVGASVTGRIFCQGQNAAGVALDPAPPTSPTSESAVSSIEDEEDDEDE